MNYFYNWRDEGYYYIETHKRTNYKKGEQCDDPAKLYNMKETISTVGLWLLVKINQEVKGLKDLWRKDGTGVE